MKIIKKVMRLWITLASAFSFFTGWVLFSHAGKPAPLQANQPAITTPAPTQSIQLFNPNQQTGGFLFPQQNQSFFTQPRLRTGGS